MVGGIVGGVFVLFLVFAVVGMLIGPGGRSANGRDRLVVAEQTPTSSTGQEETSAPAAQEEPAPTPTPSPTVAKPRTYRGAGDKVLKVEETENILLATLTHQGGANFIVNPIDPGGAEQASIVNEIGAYNGTVIVNEDHGKVLRGFKIKADGAWTLTLKPLTMAREWGGDRISGRGDEVLLLSPAASGLTTVKADHSGSSNFIVTSYAEQSRENLVNEIGSYRGEVLLPDGTVLVTVHADGRWTFTKS
ncbi:hypothetical protein ACFPOI_03645 [Nonomuraea angiospora]|uniref:Uncharacterized protein n=1 Tax=Nonomuraea angiospora TaxID=46172 RepID=A0ABR9MBC6_9ACTN|nr:hypothetical protein [Nonomuraea angiospora]MBE1590099.1 hypothetical protein [Nonomuraea angiospora]